MHKQRHFFASNRGHPIPWRLAAMTWLLAVGAMLAPPPALAADAVAEFAQGLLRVEDVVKSAAEVTREKYPNADDVLVDDYILTRYEADGKAVTWDDTFAKVLTEKGKRDYKTLRRHFTLPYNKASYALIQVIKPDGTVVPVDIEKQSRVMIDRSQIGSNIYNPNRKILQVGIPDLEIGDMVRYVAVNELVKPRVPNTWSEYEVLEYTSPVKHFVYEVLAPPELPLRNIALKSPVKDSVVFTEGKRDGRLHYRWEASNVPRMYGEPSMPPLHTVVQRLLISTIQDWRDISKWYWDLCLPHLEATAEMKEKVAELTKGLTDREKKIRAIFRFVSQEVRYMGITVEKEAPGYEPHDAKDTFENRHGVCRDKAALLVAMLRDAGFKAYPVIIHNGPRKDEEVPQPFFNHAIVAAENEDGSYMLMDPTDENTKEIFPAYLCNQSYLVAKPGGETLLTSPIVPAEDNMMRIETKALIDAHGNLSAESVLYFEGINDNAYRGYFSRIKPEERRRYFEGALKRSAAGTELKSITIEPKDMMDTETPLTIRLVYEADDILVSNGETAMLPVPRLGTSVGMVNFILGKTGLEKRKYPLKTDIACGVRETLRLRLAPGISHFTSLPKFQPIGLDTLSWQRTLTQDGLELVDEAEFLMKGVEFSPVEYLQLKEALRTMEVNARKRPIIDLTAPDESAADSVILRDIWEYELTDARNWTARHNSVYKILTYKGKKDRSELKWNYNPAWEEVKLTKAIVTTSKSTKAISEQEKNVMDAGWAGSAPRYPAAKTLVASLPGVEIGSVVEYDVTRTIKGRPFFAFRHSFRGYDPIREKRVRVIVPKGLKLKSEVFDQGTAGEEGEPVLTATCKEDGDRLIYEWTARAQAALKRESGLPPWWSFNPSVFVSTGDWGTYAKTVRTALENASSDQEKASARGAAHAAATGKGTQATLIAIRDDVAKAVRGAGPGINALPLTCITPADQILAEGYGNVTDRAVVLYTMAAAAGFRPEFVLASWSPKNPDLQRPLVDFPGASLFPDVLVRVRVAGTTVYLNDTDQYAALGVTPHDGRLALRLKRPKIGTVAALSNMTNRNEISYAMTVGADGTARITRAVRYYGDAFTANKRKFAEMPPEERRRYFQEAVARISQAAKPVSDLISEFDKYPGTESFTVSVPNYAVPDGDYLYFSLPASLTNLLRLRADERSNPLSWSEPRRTRLTTTVELPLGYQTPVLLPDEIVWLAPEDAGTVLVRVSMTSPETKPGAKRLEVSHVVDLDPAIISADEYDELLKINRALSHARARTVLLRRSTKAEDR